MAERAAATEGHGRSGHRSHVGRYAIIWIALAVLTFTTWGISRFHLPGGWGVLVALAIAITKGTLVALFFMHLWDQRGANRIVFLTSLVFVAVFIVIVITDNMTRFPLANPPGARGALPVGATDYRMPPVLKLPAPGRTGAQGAPTPR